jgi:hypothetical protein
MNYRSALIYGQFEKVESAADKRAALAAFMDKLAPGRQAEIRPGNDKEFAATTVLRIALTEAACKVRSGGPVDDEEDLGLAVWAGVLPLMQVHGQPQPDGDADGSQPAPAYVSGWA